MIGVVTQRNPDVEDPGFDDLQSRWRRLHDPQAVQAAGRESVDHRSRAGAFRLKSIIRTDPYAVGEIEVIEDQLTESPSLDALLNSCAPRRIASSSSRPIHRRSGASFNGITNPSALADFLAANLQAETADKQLLLEELDVEKRLRMIAARIATQLDVLELQSKIQSQVKENIDKSQRRYYLQEQLKAIRKELGEGDAGGRQRDRAAPPAPRRRQAARERAEGSATRTAAPGSDPSASPEYGVIRTWLQIVSELPWSIRDADKLDLARRSRSSIAITSIWRRSSAASSNTSRAQAQTGRRRRDPAASSDRRASARLRSANPSPNRWAATFIRVALGGVRDEADIRGHRRTYIGSMPGRIIAELRKAGTRNPVMMLDEIDKIGADFRGDPAAAMLEVPRPGAEPLFTDHYLDVPVRPLQGHVHRDRQHDGHRARPAARPHGVIEIPGYTELRQAQHRQDVSSSRASSTPTACSEARALQGRCAAEIIESYTREAGVRNLERNIGSVARAIAAESSADAPIKVDRRPRLRHQDPRPAPLRAGAGAAHQRPRRRHRPGVHAVRRRDPLHRSVALPGKGAITLTGQIGDVMKESATAAFSLLRSRAESLGISSDLLANSDIHIHVPAGAVPKDGPSAGTAMFTALASLHDEPPRPPRRRHDRRDHPARPGAADRRLERENPRRQARRHQAGRSSRSATRRTCPTCRGSAEHAEVPLRRER
jgi:ATP-dependent Lon protease